MIDSKEARDILSKSFSNLEYRLDRPLNSSEIQRDVINNICKYILENFNDEVVAVHQINHINDVVDENLKFMYIAELFVDVAGAMYTEKQYSMEERVANLNAIPGNISWAGMWNFLRDYFKKTHGQDIDDVSSDASIFYSQRHTRYEDGKPPKQVDVERNVNINFLHEEGEVVVSIEPTLSAKVGVLLKDEGNKLVYVGKDPTYKFTFELDNFDEVEKFILELPHRKLMIVYT